MTQTRPTLPDPADSISHPPVEAGKLGMTLFLASLSMLFVASLMGYVVIRSKAEAWPPTGQAALPTGLWISTAIILLCSVGIHWAKSSALADRAFALRAALLVTMILGLSFLVMQIQNWATLIASGVTPKNGIYGFTFFFLTALHAVHVIGGLVPLGFVTKRAWAGAYSSSRHAGVTYCAFYWHFLDAVWVIMFVVMFLT